MHTFRISDFGLPPDASRAFRSMLGIVQGRAAAHWQLTEPAQADVVLTPPGHDGTAATAKAVVYVVEERNAWLDAPFVLRHPFRVMQLLSLLDAIATQLQSTSPQKRTGATVAVNAQSLRQLLAQGNLSRWHVAEDTQGERLWVGAHAAAAAPAALAALKTGRFRPGGFVPATGEPDAACASMPRQDAAWYIGYHATPDLAPWLSAHSAYRLLRWPDFGRIAPAPSMLRLSAAAATAAMTPAALAAATQLPAAEVNRFLAAASLAGLLAAAPRSELAPRTPHASPGSWTRLLGGLRRRLGMACA